MPDDSDQTNVLIVDDLPDKVLVYTTILEDLGQNLVVARSGEEALKEVLRREFAVILLDVQMPGLDGLEVARRLRALPGLDGLRLIALSGYTQPEHRLRSAEAGFAVHLAKPCSAEDLQRALVMVAEVC